MTKGNYAIYYEGQKVVRKYSPYKQIKTSCGQQKWIGPYTIIKIHDDDNIEIKNIHQMELGRWRSNKFLPYDWVNPNQVITFYKKKTRTFPSPDYDEVHHKMLESYSIQALSKGTKESNNGVRATKIQNPTIQLSTKGNYHKNNTSSKNQAPKGPPYLITINKPTTRWLQLICNNGDIMELIIQYCHRQLSDSSIHSPSIIHTKGETWFKNKQFTKNYYIPRLLQEEFQQQKGQKPIIITTLVFKTKDNSNFGFYSTRPQETVQIKPKTKTPPKCCVNNHKVRIPSWNTHQVSRNLTDVTNCIITGPAPRTPVTNSSSLFLEDHLSFKRSSVLFQLKQLFCFVQESLSA